MAILPFGNLQYVLKNCAVTLWYLQDTNEPDLTGEMRTHILAKLQSEKHQHLPLTLVAWLSWHNVLYINYMWVQIYRPLFKARERSTVNKGLLSAQLYFCFGSPVCLWKTLMVVFLCQETGLLHILTLQLSNSQPTYVHATHTCTHLTNTQWQHLWRFRPLPFTLSLRCGVSCKLAQSVRQILW